MRKFGIAKAPLVDWFLIFLVFSALYGALFPAIARAGGYPGADNFKVEKISPGDKICIYDIASDDPLVDNESSDSLKYWYRSPSGRQKSRYELRPMARELIMIALRPGPTVSGIDKRGKPWLKASTVVIKGGATPGSNTETIRRGSNTLSRNKGRSIVSDWQILNFEKARFKKKGLFGCKRKYDKY